MRSSSVGVFGSAVVIASALFGAGCSSSGSSSAALDESSSGRSSHGDDPCHGLSLTVKDVPISAPGCLVSIAGRTAVGAGVQTVCVPTGATTLSATPIRDFELDPRGSWHDMDGDGSKGDKGTVSAGTSTITLTVDKPGTKCVWACCPSRLGEACPTSNQCPER